MKKEKTEALAQNFTLTPQISIPDDNSPMSATLRNLYDRMGAEVLDYAILLLDAAGNILNWNPGAQSIKGYQAEEIIGRNFSIFYSQHDIAAGLPSQLITQARETGKASHEGWCVKKDGSTFWGSIVITALHDSSNAVIGFSKVTRDLTERKNAEDRQERYTAELQDQNEKLRKSEERYHRMIAEVQDYAIILLDIDGNILNWNKGAQNIKGYTEDEILGKNFRNFYLPGDRASQLPEQLLAEAIARNKATHEGWRLRKDGNKFWGSILITAIHDDEGNLTGFSKVTRDLTQKKDYEDFILKQNKQLQDYAYIASHDLQEPLRKIMMFNSELRRNLDNKEKSMKFLEKIDSSSQRMSRLINAVLEYSRMGDTMESNTVVDLNEVVRDVESDFELLIQEKNVTLSYSELPAVKAMPIQIHQLFMNLIGNAIKFSNTNPVITISVIPEQAQVETLHPMVTIQVSDNGIGFKSEYSEKIFKMFHRLDNDKSGTGIGLALCKKIVENHGGTITATSTPGKGTIITFLLPAAL